MTQNKKLALNAERIVQSIVRLRGHRVLLDAELARLYGVETRVLVQAVKRNRERFPEDFMFQLTGAEAESLRSQFVISNAPGRGGRRYRPYAFTEQGVAMLSSVLGSPQAIAVNIEIMRAFVRLREVLASNAAFARKLERLEHQLAVHDGKLTAHEEAIAAVLSAIRELMSPPEPPRKRRMGFIQNDD